MKLSEQARARELYAQGISHPVIAPGSVRPGLLLLSGQLINLGRKSRVLFVTSNST